MATSRCRARHHHPLLASKCAVGVEQARTRTRAVPSESGGDDRVQADLERRRAAAANRQREVKRLGIAKGLEAVGRAAAHAASAAGVPLASAAGVALSAAVEAYATMVANRGKAKKLLDRMQLLQPAVDELAQMLDDGKLGDHKRREGALAVLTRVQGNFERARELIVEWSQHGAGFFGTLKQALSAGKFTEEFDSLREELVQRLAELQLYLAVRGVARAAVTRGEWKREDAEADKADRVALPGAIAEEAEGSSALADMLQEVGMDLGTFKAQMSKHDMSFDQARLCAARGHRRTRNLGRARVVRQCATPVRGPSAYPRARSCAPR